VRAAWIILLLAAPVAAQAPCPECTRGDTLVEHFKLEPLRALAGELAATPLGDPLLPAEYAHLVELRRGAPELVRLGAIDDADLGAIASSLCHAATGACVDTTERALHCLADRCTVVLPPPDPRRADLVDLPKDCHQFSNRQHSTPLGLGIDWGNGWQRSKYPSDGRVWSFGIEGRMRFGHTLGAVARVDRSAGPDAATDLNHDGHDDVSTGSITRFSALAGPSFVLDNTRFEDTTRSIRLDLLAGYMATGSQPNESGPAAGVDLSFQLWAMRLGMRVEQGLADASGATMALAHIGFLSGSSPDYHDETDCGAESASRATRLAVGFDFPMGGYGFSSQLGYLVPGVGVEALWHLTPAFDIITHADLLIYPGYERDRAIHQAVLAGLRIDHGKHPRSEWTTGYFTTVMAGYSLGAVLTPSTTGSGPVTDVSFAWGGQGPEGAAYVRLHGRFGLSSDNSDYRALFLSLGFELRLDPRVWRDRT
jgi:hypothetical protein